MSTSYKIAHKIGNRDLESSKIEVADLSVEELSKDKVFSLTAFCGDSKEHADRLESQMNNLREVLDWKSEATVSEYDSKVYGKGYAIVIMRKEVAPKVSEDDMNGFIASLGGSASI